MHNLGLFLGAVNTALMRKQALKTFLTLSSVRRTLVWTNVQNSLLRTYSQDKSKTGSSNFVVYSLLHRTLVKIHGHETSSFLQGLVTNDMEQLEDERCMYAHMLNVQGRTLYDIIFYSLKEKSTEPSLLLECDSTVKDAILKHLKVYKIRRKVSITPCPELAIWALLPVDKDSAPDKPEITDNKQDIVLERDPRTELMGWRLIVNREVKPEDIIASALEGNPEEYHKHRYTIGLPEGVNDLPPGVALPLESNLVYMNGINFSKGCYIGQELTARTHHTGVVRKRLMPVRLSAPVDGLQEGVALQTNSEKPAGKYRAGKGEHGLSLIRLAHAKEPLALKPSQADGSSVTLQVSVPEWWPNEAK
ncbi:putative transferase CAF17 homolog, mitochondrial [Clupea harengus]|uniref:Iron-sulfur cluster assembly factor IBA57, mitochondrial n=1 Tax=Clupea harengus TaxID=7950 RepID=A0A6P3VX45_CLUHA|nr:putative transferase CAF17 homolog, mitochondrial [Clupea harengus]